MLYEPGDIELHITRLPSLLGLAVDLEAQPDTGRIGNFGLRDEGSIVKGRFRIAF